MDLAKNKSITVVITCYNYGRYLAECIESVQNQTYPATHIVVVDDASTDNTEEVAKGYNVAYVRNEQNRGVSYSRNKGITMYPSDYIVCVDADDYLDADYLKKCIEQTKHYDIVTTWCNIIGEQKPRVLSKDRQYINYAMMRAKNYCNTSAIFPYRLFQKYGGFDEDMQLGYEDWELWRRYAMHGASIYIIPEPLLNYRKHGGGRNDKARPHHEHLKKYITDKHNYKGIDVVIPLGVGSISANNELRFCLRSIEKHLNGYGNIWIVGHLPKWVQNVRHIPHGEYHPKALNIFDKIMAACEIEEVSDNFIMFNDDYFLIQSVDAAHYPNYYSDKALGEVYQRSASNPYRQLTEDTIKVVGDGFRYADIHCPLVMNKGKFKQLIRFNPNRYDNGLLVKSLYMSQIDGTKMERKDPIIRGPRSAEWYDCNELTTDMISIHDEAVNKEFISYIERKFPVPSQYER